MGDAIVLAVLMAVICLIVRSMVKNHKKGGGCSGNCSSCSKGCMKYRESSSEQQCEIKKDIHTVFDVNILLIRMQTLQSLSMFFKCIETLLAKHML